jgi:hypothetical protein
VVGGTGLASSRVTGSTGSEETSGGRALKDPVAHVRAERSGRGGGLTRAA